MPSGFLFCAMKEWAEWFYNSREWEECRDGFLASKGWLCERCSTPENPVPAKIAHHKKYLTRANIHDPAVALCWDNLESLCQDCHNREHHRKGADRYRFDAAGNLAPIPPIRKNFFDRRNTEAAP